MKFKTIKFLILILSFYCEVTIGKANLDYCKPLMKKFTIPMSSFSYANYRSEYQYRQYIQDNDEFDIRKDPIAILDSSGKVSAINPSKCESINCVINANSTKDKGVSTTKINFKVHRWQDYKTLRVEYNKSRPRTIKLGYEKGSDDKDWKQTDFQYTKDGKCIPGEITYDRKIIHHGQNKSYKGKVSSPGFCKNLHEIVKDINAQMAAVNKCKNLFTGLKDKFSKLKDFEKREDDILEDDLMYSIRTINEGIESAGSGLARKDNYNKVFTPHTKNAPLWEIGDAYRWRCQVYYPESFFEDKELWSRNSQSGLYKLNDSIFSSSKGVTQKDGNQAVSNE